MILRRGQWTIEGVCFQITFMPITQNKYPFYPEPSTNWKFSRGPPHPAFHTHLLVIYWAKDPEHRIICFLSLISCAAESMVGVEPELCWSQPFSRTVEADDIQVEKIDLLLVCSGPRSDLVNLYKLNCSVLLSDFCLKPTLETMDKDRKRAQGLSLVQ